MKVPQITLLNKIKQAEKPYEKPQNADIGGSEPKPKRVISDEAKARMKAAREAKKEAKKALELEEAKKQQEEASHNEEAEKQKLLKKEAALAKRRETLAKKKAETDSGVSVSSEEKIEAPKKSKNTDVPPPWFTTFVTDTLGEKLEELGMKVSKKELKADGKAAAQEKWENIETRGKVRHAVDNHLSNMYSTIFS